ncbi:MAG: aminotransferase class V-fold PLP-dependent enzyme [Bacteroidota bacterium]
MKKIYFTPGPSELFFTVNDHIKNALKEQIPSISHRSGEFKKIVANTKKYISELLNLPEGYHIAFLSSATEIWERIIQNTVEEKSLHIVNGAFSSRFYEIASSLGKSAIKLESNEGSCHLLTDEMIENDVELIAFTHNETSTGAMHPMEDVYEFKSRNKDVLIALDVVSSVPCVEIDYSKVDCAYFSVQKSFGLPAGLGVWIYNERVLEKADKLKSKGLKTGSYHTISSLHKKILEDQTPETPNMLNIYLLGKVAEDMLQIGLPKIRRDINYKSAVLYQALENHSSLKPFVSDEKFRSKTVIVAETGEKNSADILKILNQSHLVVGSGYGKRKQSQIRIANFAAHSNEQIEMLADRLSQLN